MAEYMSIPVDEDNDGLGAVTTPTKVVIGTGKASKPSPGILADIPVGGYPPAIQEKNRREFETKQADKFNKQYFKYAVFGVGLFFAVGIGYRLFFAKKES